MNKYIIFGAGGHAKIIIDILKNNNEEISGILDPDKKESCLGYEILGDDNYIYNLDKNTTYAALGIGHIGDVRIRNRVYENAREYGLIFPNVIHKSAVISDYAKLNDGILCAANSVINADARIGSICIINTSAVVEHEVEIGYGTHIAPNATVLGGAQIGDNTFIGAGSVVIQGIEVGSNCIIGAGTIVTKNVPDNSVVVGTPGKIIKKYL